VWRASATSKPVKIGNRRVSYNAVMPDAPLPQRRRWFRFSLRTFVGVFTAIAVWLGWNAHLVQRRKEFVASLPWPYMATPQLEASLIKAENLGSENYLAIERGDQIFVERQPPLWTLSYTGIPIVEYDRREPTRSELPWIRRILGDRPYWVVSYFPGPPIDRATELFPEAVVMVAKRPWPWPEVTVSRQGTDGWHYRYANPSESKYLKSVLKNAIR
jgi:hypothetical protein